MQSSPAGAQGIGLSIARALAEQGCNVAITGRRLNVLEEAAESFGGHAGKNGCFR